MSDERVARLYGLPLERFTAERNALAAELRAEGDAEGAQTVKALRKPSAAAWAVNQLVRAEPDLVEALLGAGGELRQAHRQAASGRGAAQLRAAAEAERAAVERLVERAPVVLGRPVGGTLADSIRNTLHAASSDDDARERVAAGTLEHELRPVGLGPRSGAPAAVDSALAVAEQAHRAAEAERARELRAAAAAQSALERERDAAARALLRAEQAYARAREAADLAAERVKEVSKRVRAAEAGLREARRLSGEREKRRRN